MDKQQTLDHLDAAGIHYEIREHPAVFTMAQMQALGLPYPEADAKNLFVRDAKKRNYYLLTVHSEHRVDLKEFREYHGLRSLSMASADDLAAILDLEPGSVNPLGLLHDTEHRVELYLDSAFADGLVAMHPNDNTATVWLRTDDLVRVLREHGSAVHVVDF